ncbi:MAG: DUF4258 domain-containing protein [Solirubrobacteraceae bacterium]
MRFSRHARNEMRLYRLTRQDVAAVVASPQERDMDERGNLRLIGQALDGRRILVVIAEDDQDFVITVFLRS